MDDDSVDYSPDGQAPDEEQFQQNLADPESIDVESFQETAGVEDNLGQGSVFDNPVASLGFDEAATNASPFPEHLRQPFVQKHLGVNAELQAI